jgi:hypothetical protein
MTNIDKQTEQMADFIDEMQPTANKIYIEAKKDGQHDDQILDQLLDILRRAVSAQDTHGIGDHKTELYVEGVRKIIAKTMFLEACRNAEVR